MAIIKDFKSRFNFDKEVVDDKISKLILVYKSYYNFDYSDSTKETILQLLAHMLIIEVLDSAQSGNNVSIYKNITSKSLGDLSLSYSDIQTEDIRVLNYLGTSYGRNFLELIKTGAGANFV